MINGESVAEYKNNDAVVNNTKNYVGARFVTCRNKEKGCIKGKISNVSIDAFDRHLEDETECKTHN